MGWRDTPATRRTPKRGTVGSRAATSRSTTSRATKTRSLLVLIAVGLSVLTACNEDADANIDPEQVDAVEAPELGACRDLMPDDVAKTTNATRTVECTEAHTAETYAVGTLPSKFADVDYTSKEVAAFAYKRCSTTFEKFLGATESLVMRSVVSWAWFRPSEKAWDDGARWYRCDIVGGGEQSKEYVDLPRSAKGLLLGTPEDKWLVCAQGKTVSGSVKVPCSDTHDWRAVTTIKVGAEDEDYPGDRMVQVTSRDFCSKSVAAWMGYPSKYDFAFTWFHKAEWELGNRRSVCWAKTQD